MKTSLIFKSITTFVILIFAAEISFAKTHDPEKTNDLKTIITKNIVYPEFAKDNRLSGFVVVAFAVDNAGKINVKEINADSDYFQQYVEAKLKDLVLADPQRYQNKTIYYRFDFHLLNQN